MKALPQNLEAEQSLLGCILSNSNTLVDLIGYIDPSDFYSTKHSILYSALENLFSDNKSINMITVTNYLKEINSLVEVGGITYISQLAGSGVGNARSYAEIIKELSNRRKLIKLAKEVQEQAYTKPSKDIISTAEEQLFKINTTKENKAEDMESLLTKTLETLEKGIIPGISTGWEDLNKVYTLQRTDLIILAARPSMGKSAFALNIGLNVAKEHSVLMFSLEMSKEQMMQRILASETMIKLNSIRSCSLTDKEWNEIAQATGYIANKKFIIDDSSGLTLSEIKAKAKKVKMQRGLDVIIVDYLQLISSTGRTRSEEVNQISTGLKALAKELDVTVIALSQLSRACETRNDKRPMLSDLRDSGGIEQDSDIISFLYRDEYYNKETEEPGITEIITGKNRNGTVGTVKLAWLGECQRFCGIMQ